MTVRRRSTVDDGGASSSNSSFASLFAAHHDELLRLAYLLCGDAEQAEDLVADVFARVHRPWLAGRVTDERAYLRRALVNQTNSWLRRLRLERAEARRQHADDRGRADAQQQVVDRDHVFDALRRLPRRQRTAIVLRYYADLTVEATAAAMDVTPGTVKASVSRGLRTLRLAIREEVGR